MVNIKQSESMKRAYKEGRKIAWELGNPNPKKPRPSKEVLESQYIRERKSTWVIAHLHNVSQTQIRRWFIHYGIPRRSYSEVAKITLNGFKSDEKHLNWKGDSVQYQALHTWIRRKLGVQKKCQHCGTEKEKKYEWANISKKYKRDIKDWLRLCTSCHRKFDGNNNLLVKKL